MKHTYLFAFGKSLGTYDEVKAFLDNSSIIETWRYEITNVFFIVSKSNAEEICNHIRDHFGEDKGMYLVSRYSDDSQGWLSNKGWQFLENENYHQKNSIENNS